MYSWEAEARFDVGCAKEDRRVREGYPCILYICEELQLGRAESNGRFVVNGGDLVHHNVSGETGHRREVAETVVLSWFDYQSLSCMAAVWREGA